MVRSLRCMVLDRTQDSMSQTSLARTESFWGMIVHAAAATSGLRSTMTGRCTHRPKVFLRVVRLYSLEKRCVMLALLTLVFHNGQHLFTLKNWLIDGQSQTTAAITARKCTCTMVPTMQSSCAVEQCCSVRISTISTFKHAIGTLSSLAGHCDGQ